MSGLVNDHAVTRSVRDSAALLDATQGPEPGDPYYAMPPERLYAKDVGADPGRMRIAYSVRSATGPPLHEDCIAAVKDAAALCQELGHEVEEADPPVNGEQLIECFTDMWAGGNTWTIDSLAPLVGKTPEPQYFETLTWALYEMGKEVTAARYLTAVSAFQMLGRQMAAFHKRYDLWLTPTLGSPPVPLGYIQSTPEEPMLGFDRAAEFVPFTPVQNATGQPAMSVPLHWNSDGLPIGVHFVARFGEEPTLFRLAAQLEEARPWAGKHPPVSA